MKIAVIGAGWVGVTTAAVLASLEHQVQLTDLSTARVEQLRQGQLPFFEPGLAELLRQGLSTGKLNLTSSNVEAIKTAELVLLCVGTPTLESGSTDLGPLLAAATDFFQHHQPGAVLVVRSTIPPGTCQQLKVTGEQQTAGFYLAHTPEFLAEGTAVKDSLQPSRLIFGVDSQVAETKLRQAFASLIEQGTPVLVTDFTSAELIKCSSNSYLATRISFMNEIANLTQVVGGDPVLIARGMSFDSRIGHIQPGVGYGGGCFPKDVQALLYQSQQAKTPLQVLQAAHQVNHFQKERLYQLVAQRLGNLVGKHIAIWGLAFKANTDDVRESPALYFAKEFLRAGATVTAYDPKVKRLSDPDLIAVAQAASPVQAAQQADALVMLCAWEEFGEVALADVAQVMRGRLLVDGRFFWSRAEVEKSGLEYLA
jgi:UDPglucose 6-dehydrogenase